jgi:serine/threonine protein kinase/beta-lactam-binding protein with PASTA domain
MIGTVLGNRYEIISEIGSGGMANVYMARCRYLQRNVAIKILKDEFKDDVDFLKRFETEAQAAASLTHPNIVQIYDVGADKGYYYIVMELVEGITLKQYITEKGSLDWREAVNILIQVCGALNKAHSRKIIHRDIKPQNILMTNEGVPKVTDFGIARAASADTATMKIDTIGSVHYSSPEQIRGGYTDEKSDIYSIGVTLFEAVTGKLPFNGESSISVALKHIQDIPPLPTDIKPGIPSALNMIIMRAMAKSRQDRYDSVAEMMRDLENIRSKPSELNEIVLPNVRHDRERFNTRKLELLEDNELSGKGEIRRRRGSNKSMRVVMPFIYLILIATIALGIFFFVRAILEGIKGDIVQPEDIIVKNYVGRNVNEVMAELDKEGIQYDTPEYVYDDVVEKDMIISQSPLPETKIKAGSSFSRLKLTVSKGKDVVQIPEVKMEDHTALKLRLEDEGLIVIEVSEYSEEVAANFVIRSDPIPGTTVKRGSTITVYWSLGPEKEKVVVPNLVGLTYDEAVLKLLESNLKLGNTYPEDREGFQGKIVRQEPKTGVTVDEETPIDIFFEDDTATPTPPGGDPAGPVDPGDPGNTGGNVTTTNKTIMVPLPAGVQGDTVRLKVLMVNNKTNDETIIFDWDVEVSKFTPDHPVVVPVPNTGGYTVKAYINNRLVKEQGF